MKRIEAKENKRSISRYLSVVLIAMCIICSVFVAPPAFAYTAMSSSVTEAAIARAQLMKANNLTAISNFRGGQSNKTVADYYHFKCALFVWDMFYDVGFNVSSGDASVIRVFVK